MSRLRRPTLSCLVLTTALIAPHAAAAADEEAQARRQIDEQRAAIEQRHRARELECRQRFAVTACLEAAGAERRQALQPLQQQRALLDDAERKRRAARRLERIEQRGRAQALAPAAALPVEGGGAPAAAPAASGPLRDLTVRPPRTRQAIPPDEQAAQAQAFRERQREAEALQAEVRRRLAEREAEGRSTAPLSVPPIPPAPR
ncbi:hypothetical protein [Aquabacterium sp. J223]|uniref:hypothetical protein n=1 Tax=Aquabacterium sp. J223 TaxID=2898431 RepID=UPI0021AE0D94|nr:hypothetical protein [Aquabacterium sp. J223]UUX97012.1 hypothetical protein LRS07_07065 [Aquabacterium sp. J223]